jgi:hypothetical protein
MEMSYLQVKPRLSPIGGLQGCPCQTLNSGTQQPTYLSGLSHLDMTLVFVLGTSPGR